jgi:NADH-quinone oxidoreductase subunit F
MPKVAVVGSGPAGLTAAHYLSLKGYKVTVFEAERHPGGMLLNCIPDYRLPHDILKGEIESILNENITVECNKSLGGDFSIDDLFTDGYKAVFLAIGAHKSWKLGIEGEEIEGVYPSIQFLKAFDTRGGRLARGRVGIVGGGNSAIDAARVALRQESAEIMSIADSARTAFRQEGVETVSIYYRRTRADMPAFKDEIEAATQEGIQLNTLVSPVEVISKDGRLTGLKIIENRLGDYDSSGRRRPVPVPGSERIVPLDTLIVAISETPDSDCLKAMGIEIIESDGTLKVDKQTLCTNREGVFGGGDLVSGPNTVVDAIAAGKRGAIMIDRYLQGQEMKQPSESRLPKDYIEPAELSDLETEPTSRVRIPTIPVSRRRNFAEVEIVLSVEDATREARRCLRCDLEFTQPEEKEEESRVAEGQTV